MAQNEVLPQRLVSVIFLLILQSQYQLILAEELSPSLKSQNEQDPHLDYQGITMPNVLEGKVFISPDCPSFSAESGHLSTNSSTNLCPSSKYAFQYYECCVPVSSSDAYNCYAYPIPNLGKDSENHPQVQPEETETKILLKNPEESTFTSENVGKTEGNSEIQKSSEESPNDKNGLENQNKILELSEPRSWDCDCTNEAIQMNSIPDIILSSRLNSSFRRFNTFKRTLELMLKYNAKILVETGTARFGNTISCVNDGCSTMFFGHYALLTKSILYSVDISQASCAESIKSTEQFKPYVNVVLSDSVKFLQEFNYGPVDFLYLDSFDWSEVDSEQSQKHHLEEIKSIYPKLHRRTIILIDDCDLPHGGKCKMVHDFLMEQGWTMVMKDYQQLYLYQK